MDYVVEGTPAACRAAVQAHIAKKLPNYNPGSGLRQPTDDQLLYSYDRSKDRPNGVLLLIGLALTILTLGAYLVAWLFWIIVIREPYRLSITLTAEPPGKTRLKVSASRKTDGEALEAWIQEELVEKQGALAYEAPVKPSLDTADQIRRLAELREQGILSSQEFETKKANLLDRM